MTQAGKHMRLPPERFYWALLDASVLPRRLTRPTEGLGFLLEPLVPRPLEEVHATFLPLTGRRYLACAIDRDVLESSRSADLVTLGPASLPAFVRESVDPGRINLLTGSFTPPAVARVTTRWRWTVLAAAMAAVVLALVGLERRIAAADSRAAELAQRTAEVESGVLGPMAARSPLPLPLQLEAEVRSLRRTRSSDVPLEATPDAALALAALLEHWPRKFAIETDSVHVTEESLHVQARLPSSDEAQALATALAVLPGWKLAQPSLHALGDGVRATVQLQRVKESPR